MAIKRKTKEEIQDLVKTAKKNLKTKSSNEENEELLIEVKKEKRKAPKKQIITEDEFEAYEADEFNTNDEETTEESEEEIESEFEVADTDKEPIIVDEEDENAFGFKDDQDLRNSIENVEKKIHELNKTPIHKRPNRVKTAIPSHKPPRNICQYVFNLAKHLCKCKNPLYSQGYYEALNDFQEIIFASGKKPTAENILELYEVLNEQVQSEVNTNTCSFKPLPQDYFISGKIDGLNTCAYYVRKFLVA